MWPRLRSLLDGLLARYCPEAIPEATERVRHRATLEHTHKVIYCHDPTLCTGQTCSLHNRSDHALRAWRQHWRSDTGVMERLCLHGCGHPDPDHLAYQRRVFGEVFERHGCDGCCMLISASNKED